ncbi:hypothetical protein C1H76_3231 [Elsinoe australis]|uniref:DUF1772-domain-containing protein n=1 Tax=Elsinoe australis TaxID=40998 RepID=A0A2P8A0N5_9PEZI|nr:hypothetical protein B9Z65_7840 [Elsinoe australis]TKX24622.1 hypothetical protein C1H76_3231 [Elsinoe australis]
MADTTTTSLQALGLSAAFILSGFSAGISWTTLPATYRISPSAALPIFKDVFYEGGAFVVPFGVLNLLITGAAAYRNAEQRIPLSIAAALLVAPIVFTRIVMFPGIQKLLAFEQSSPETQTANAGEIIKLLKAWSAQNYARAGMFFVAGSIGLYLLLEKLNGKQKRL